MEMEMEIDISPSQASNSSQKIKKAVINNDMRKLIIDALNRGQTYAEVSNMFQLNYKTVYHIYNVYKKEGCRS